MQVAFGAYAEPIKQQITQKTRAFKVSLVASDCVLLGAYRI